VRWRQVVLLYAVLAALGVEYWLVERSAPPPARARPARQRFLAVRADDLRELRLVRGDRRVVSQRAAGRWSVVEPAGAPIPADLIAAFADALSAAEEIDSAPAAGGDAGAYGLDEAAARVEIVPVSGDPVTVTIGATNPTGTAVYARRGGSSDVILIGRNVRYYEELIFQALPGASAPPRDGGAPVG
jgi:hypothetical protein